MEGTSNNKIEIYIVRHGETKANLEKMVQGQGDSPLTEKGVSQVKKIS